MFKKCNVFGHKSYQCKIKQESTINSKENKNSQQNPSPSTIQVAKSDVLWEKLLKWNDKFYFHKSNQGNRVDRCWKCSKSHERTSELSALIWIWFVIIWIWSIPEIWSIKIQIVLTIISLTFNFMLFQLVQCVRI